MPVDYSKFDRIVDSDDEKPDQSCRTVSSSAKPPEKTTCHGCGMDISSKPLRCSRCQRVAYCSAECQRGDWAYHKRACNKPEDTKAKAEPERRSESAVAKEDRRKKAAEDKVIDNGDEELTWYRHREWKPTAEPKKDFAPTPVSPGAESPAAVVPGKQADGSAWNAAGTWEDRDVTEFATRTIKEKLRDFLPVDCAAGAVSIEEVCEVEGEASKPVIRGKRRHIFDLSFKAKFLFKWMDSSGQRHAKGTIEVADFTNDVFSEGADARPELSLKFPDSRLLDDARQQAVQVALGTSSWPPSSNSLADQLAQKLKDWARDFEEAS